MQKAVSKLVKQYDRIQPAAKAAFWFTISNFILKAIDVITVPIYTRMMSEDQYGIVSLFNSWQKVLIIFATLHFSSSGFNVGMVQFEDDRDKFTSALQGLSTCCVGLFALLYLLFYPFLKQIIHLPPELMAGMIIYFFVGPSFDFWCARQRFEYQYRKLMLMTISVAAVIPMISIGAIYLTAPEYKSYALILTVLAVNICVGIVFYIYNVKKGKTFHDAATWKFALQYNVPLLPHFLSRMVLSHTDRIMIEQFFGPAQAAFYTVAYNAGQYVTLLYSSITVAYHPWNFSNLKKQKYDEIKKVTNLIIVFFAGIIVLLILMAPEVMAILAPNKYNEAIYVIPPVAASVFFQLLYTFFGNIEQFFMKTKFMSIASFIAAALNFGLNMIFIPRYGYVAAAYTTLVCYIAYAIGHYMFMKRICSEKLEGRQIYDEKSILLMSIAIIVFAVLINFVYDIMWLRWTIFAVLFVILFIKRDLIIDNLKIMMKKEK